MIDYSAEVAEARVAGRPVVGVESSVWFQGLPQPEGLAAARECSEIIREAGATPAILAISGGRLRIGVPDDELESMLDGVVKVSMRDLPTALALGWKGATTVSAGLWMCVKAGLRMFVTGGIGGVHRGGVWDVSTDLLALERLPVTVVCSGAKSLLDIPATLERLETAGVPVIGYRTDRFPVFYAPSSPWSVSATVQTVSELAGILRTAEQLGWSSGMLVANPIPSEDAIPAADLENLLAEAHHQAAAEQVSGKALTPFILSYLHRKTGGATLRANLSLLRANARLAAETLVLAH
ncbi:MAG: pseudouridine-5'-phosphate glycosidase [Candidatus Xenobia bacterium]